VNRLKEDLGTREAGILDLKTEIADWGKRADKVLPYLEDVVAKLGVQVPLPIARIPAAPSDSKHTDRRRRKRRAAQA
jgi:hypothetical protein